MNWWKQCLRLENIAMLNMETQYFSSSLTDTKQNGQSPEVHPGYCRGSFQLDW